MAGEGAFAHALSRKPLAAAGGHTQRRVSTHLLTQVVLTSWRRSNLKCSTIYQTVTGPTGDLFKSPAKLFGLGPISTLERADRILPLTRLFLACVRVLDDGQVERRCALKWPPLIDPHHPGHDLFYEFHSNESANPATVLFHALGAWRIAPGFHDLLWNPAF